MYIDKTMLNIALKKKCIINLFIEMQIEINNGK